MHLTPRVMPNQFIAKVALPKNLIHGYLNVVGLFPVQVNINCTIGRKKLAHQNKALPEKLHKTSSADLVLVGLLFISALEVLHRGKWGIDINKPNARRWSDSRSENR